MPVPKKQAPTIASRTRSNSVIDRIGQEYDWSAGLKVNLYGKSGTGKTTFWSSFPGPILCLLCSGSDKPGELRSIDAATRRKIHPVVLGSSSEVQDLVEHQRGGAGYATVVLDHASGLQDLVLKEVLGLKEIPAQLSWGLATQQQYGQVALQMKERLRALLNLDCNVVIVAQERDFDNDGNSDVIMPYVASALSPSVVGWLNPACDYICQTFIRSKTRVVTSKIGTKELHTKEVIKGQVEYCLRTSPDPVYTTKFRVPKGFTLPDVIVDPTYEQLIAIINGQAAAPAPVANAGQLVK